MIAVLLAFAVGASIWTLAEYLLHRFAGHWPRGKIDFSREHLGHHATPTYFTPTAKKVATAGVATGLLAPMMILAAGVAIGVSAVSGFILAYTIYEIVHRRCHVRGPRNAYGRLIRRHHLHHHFGAPRKNHGVTSPLWDVVFRTYERPARVGVPHRHAMSWLLDEGGEVAGIHRRDYVLRRPGQKRVERLRLADREAAFENAPPA